MTSKDIRNEPKSLHEIKDTDLRALLATLCSEYREMSEQESVAKEVKKNIANGWTDSSGVYHQGFKDIAGHPELRMVRRVDGEGWMLMKMAGRSYLDQKALKVALLEVVSEMLSEIERRMKKGGRNVSEVLASVDVSETIEEAWEMATKEGEDYFTVRAR